MDSFPSDFNFETVEKKLYQQVSVSEEAAKYRKMIFDTCQNAQKHKQEFFRVNLKDVSESIKVILIKDLFERFPTIGYICDIQTETDMLMSIFTMKPNDDPEKIMGSLGQKLPEGKRRIVELKKGTFVNANEYVVAMTKNFAQKMTTFVA